MGAAQKLTGYGILAVLGLITVGLLVQQSRFNPAVIVALRAPALKGRPQAAAGRAQAATAALIPEVPGFTPLAPVESYNPDNLSDKIDGKAELYLSAGFKEMSCRSFGLGAGGRGACGRLSLRYGFSPKCLCRVQRPTPSRFPQQSPDRQCLCHEPMPCSSPRGGFTWRSWPTGPRRRCKSPWRLTPRRSWPSFPPQGETKNQAALFPKEGLALDTVRLSAADTFGLEGLNNVLTGEYSLKGGKATAFMAQRDTPEQAQAEAKRYLDFLAANGYQKVQAPAPAGDIPVLVLDNSFEIVFVEGRTLAGVHDATSLAAALELAAKLRTGLKGKP